MRNNHDEYDTMSDLLMHMLWPEVELHATVEEALGSELQLIKQSACSAFCLLPVQDCIASSCSVLLLRKQHVHV